MGSRGSGSTTGQASVSASYDISDRNENKDAVQQASALLGRKVSGNDLAQLAGAPAGSSVTVRGSEYEIVIRFKAPDGSHGARIVYKDENGVYMNNDDLHAGTTGQGTGTKIFALQVKTAIRLGIPEIHTEAAGGPNGSKNGYYTWARLGYRIPLHPQLRQAAKAAGFGDVPSTQELMAKPGGKQWWKANGGDDHGVFDLRKGSTSRKMLSAYLKETGS